MRIAVEDYKNIKKYYEQEVERLTKANNLKDARKMQVKLELYLKSKKELIEFLVRNNILPKYGFPVDTVELYPNMNDSDDNNVQMVRDLQMAVSEYAPDAQVVADGKMYTSRYIRRLPQSTGEYWETVYIAQCDNPSCKIWNYRPIKPDDKEEVCVSCKQPIKKEHWKAAIEPRKGFIAQKLPDNVPMHKPEKIYRSDDFYIGDTQRNVIEKYAFILKDGNKFKLETSINDSLMVVCNEDFYVCPSCGYAESVSSEDEENKKDTEDKKNKKFNSHKKSIKKEHITPWDKKCNDSLRKYKLCHVFKTDVVNIIFATERANDQKVMISVMYALLEGLSSVMDIERNDIKGCLHKINYNGRLIYSIVLYDAVAGGAGHVRRMVSESGEEFKKVVEKAISITKGCKCDPSCYNCLRNYYNQRIHDLLDRKCAYEFLEDYCGDLEQITDEEFLIDRLV